MESMNPLDEDSLILSLRSELRQPDLWKAIAEYEARLDPVVKQNLTDRWDRLCLPDPVARQ